MTIKPLLAGKHVIEGLDWRFVECLKRRKNLLAVRTVDHVPDIKQQPNSDNLCLGMNECQFIPSKGTYLSKTRISVEETALQILQIRKET
jgi:hypothetical protein